MARVYHRDSNGRFASGGGGRRPKTAAGRASANLRAAQKARSANPFDKKAANKAITAQAAKEYYKEFGGGRKGAAKPGAKKKAPAKPKTPMGRAGANLRAAEKAMARNPYDKKAGRKWVAAREARTRYNALGTGRKGAAKPGPKGGSRRKR